MGDALEDVRLATGDDVKELQKQSRALERRVAELEGDKPKKRKTSKKM